MTVSSPCIGLCQLGGETCLGCGRTLDEIARWGVMAEAERQDVMAALPERILGSNPIWGAVGNGFQPIKVV